jgi:hypothetical protein
MQRSGALSDSREEVPQKTRDVVLELRRIYWILCKRGVFGRAVGDFLVFMDVTKNFHKTRLALWTFSVSLSVSQSVSLSLSSDNL